MPFKETQTKQISFNLALTLVWVTSLASFSEACDICCWIFLLNSNWLISSSLPFRRLSGNLKPVSMCRLSVELLFTWWRSLPPSLQSMPLMLDSWSFNENVEHPIIFASSRHNFCSKLFFSSSNLSKSCLRCLSVCTFCDIIDFVFGDSVGDNGALSFSFIDVEVGEGNGRSTFLKIFGVRVLFRILFASAIIWLKIGKTNRKKYT